MPEIDLPSSIYVSPSRRPGAEQDRGLIRRDDYSVAADLLRMERARDAGFVRSVLEQFTAASEDPIDRTDTPRPMEGQPIFLLGARLPDLPKETIPDRINKRGVAFGRFIADTFGATKEAASLTIAERRDESRYGERVVLARFVFPTGDLVQAGFRASDVNVNAFDPSTGIWHAANSAAHKSETGRSLTAQLGSNTQGLNLKGPYLRDPFAKGAYWGLFHTEVLQSWVPSPLEGSIDTDPGIHKPFSLEGFQLHPLDEENVAAWVFGFARKKFDAAAKRYL